MVNEILKVASWWGIPNLFSQVNNAVFLKHHRSMRSGFGDWHKLTASGRHTNSNTIVP
jgi:hypothetical protein